MTASGAIWHHVFAATEALVFRSGVDDLASAVDLVRRAPAFEPADPDGADYWRTVMRLAGGAGSSIERALELTQPERLTFAKALFFVFCALSTETPEHIALPRPAV